jgi:hypothetical protein
MSAMENTTYRRLPDANAWSFGEPPRDPQHAPYTSAPSMDLSSDDSIPLFLSDPQGEPDPREFALVAASRRTSILTRVVAGGMVVSAFAILVAVAIFNLNVTRVVVDKASGPMGGAPAHPSAMQTASNQPAVREIPPTDSAVGADPVTVGSVSASSPRLETAMREETPSREAFVSAPQAPPQTRAPATRTANEAAAPPSRTLDAETLAAMTTRARKLLALGDITAARLLLERAANAQDATAAFLLAQTYDPAVLGVRDARSTAPDPEMAREWYRKAAGLGSADAQQRLAQLQN